MSLNMVRTFRVNPRISAWTQIHGAYNFLAHPIAPAGIRVAVHEKPKVCETWGLHALDGFYVAQLESTTDLIMYGSRIVSTSWMH
jgi:hypothetical protein